MNITFKEQLCSNETGQRFLKTLLFAMRAGFFYVAFVILSMQLLLAHHGNSQNLDSTFVTLETQSESLKAILKKIERQTELRFTYSEDAINEHPRIVLPKERWSVKELLDFALNKENAFTYVQVRNSYIIIKERTTPEEVPRTSIEPKTPTSLLLVTGTVKDASTQAPLPGVNIIVKGTTRGTTTDSEGNFAIAADDNEVLVFSFIGYKTFETLVDSRSAIEVAMEVDMQTLKLVEVNAGYWQVKEKESTGNISSITAEEIQMQPVGNPMAALIGRMPGVYIQQTSGVPGSGYDIRIRGQNSLRTGFGNNGNLPLYVVDGVPFPSTAVGINLGAAGALSPLNSISPSDIKSIEVLKDADATAIYGSRGANGVILITTKKGSSGKSKLDIDFNRGVGKVTNTMDLLNTEQYLEMRMEAFANDGMTPGSSHYDVNGVWDMNRYTDWQKVLIGGTADYTNAKLSFSGGNDNTRFLISANYFKEGTVFPSSFANERKSIHFNVDYNSHDARFNMVFTGTYVLGKNRLPSEDLTYYGINLPPNAPKLYDENGDLNWENSTWDNPMAQLRDKYKGTTDNLIGNLVLNYKILPGLNIKSNIGYNTLLADEISTTPKNFYDPAYWYFYERSALFSFSSLKTWILEPQISWDKVLGSGRLNILMGTTFQESVHRNITLSASNFSSDALLESIGAAGSVDVSRDNYKQYRYQGLFSRINYIWTEKYIINLTARRDGSSRFGPGKRYANFGAVGVAWIFTKEDFLNDGSKFLTFGKLRASYGTTGNDQIPDYGYIDLYKTADPYQNTTGLYPDNLFNPNYGWELTRKLEGGLELGFNQDRIFLNLSYYHNVSSNQLVGLSLPNITGFSSVNANLPAEVQNTGWELVLNSTNIEKDKFSWTTSLNITVSRNKLVSYPDFANSSYANRYILGQPLGIEKTFTYLGVDKTTGEYSFLDAEGNPTPAPSSSSDQISFVDLTPEFHGGLQNSIRYKNWQLDIFLQFVKQEGRNYLFSTFLPPGFAVNQPTYVLNRWRQPGDESDVQKFTQSFSSSQNYSNAFQSGDAENAYSDASFLRLKTIFLSYQLAGSLIHKIGLQNCRIYLQGQNLFTLTNYLGNDPENQSRYALPPLRVLTAGIQLTF